MSWNNYRKGKYNAKKTVIDGIKFDSKKEAQRYVYLKDLEEKGEITNLQRQVKFEIQPSFKHNGKTIRAINYFADFVYASKDGIIIVEDSKGFKTPEYLLKKKLLLFRGIEIQEV